MVREGSVQSNHSELTSKTSTHLAFSAQKWFEKVRGGSRGFKHIKPHRTFSNYILTEITRYIEFFYTSSGWFDCTEPSHLHRYRCAGCLCTSSGWFKHTEPLLNLLELHLHRDNKVYRVLLNEFGVVRLYRTFSNYISSGVLGVICTGSGRLTSLAQLLPHPVEHPPQL